MICILNRFPRSAGLILRRILHGDTEQLGRKGELLRKAVEMLDKTDQREDIAAFTAGEAMPARAVFVDGEGAVGILAAVGAAAAERTVIQSGALPNGNARQIFGQFCFQNFMLHLHFLTCKYGSAFRSFIRAAISSGCRIIQIHSHGEAEIKVLVELFQKLAGFQRAAPFGRTPQSAKCHYARSSAGVNPIKRSGGSFFGEGRPAIEGAPK